MNASLVCLLAAVAAPPQIDNWTTVYKPSVDFSAAIRGQTPGFDDEANSGGPPAAGWLPTTFMAQPNGEAVNPFQAAPLTQDPFLGSPGLAAPTRPYPGGSAFGRIPSGCGPQPYRWGWTARHVFGYIPKVETQGNLGNFGVGEIDYELQYTTALPYAWVFSFTQQYNLRLWDGPHSKTPASIGLPGNVHRFGWDFEFSTPANNPWSIQLALNPSINSDFDRQTSSNAWNLDGRAIVFYRVSPYWMVAVGAAYWDRVNDRVIPNAGAIWTPDDRWEWRLVFPQPRVSYFLGNPWGLATWVYVSGEYHVEAYEVEVASFVPGPAKDKIELEDWRLLFGVRNSNNCVSSFLEAGFVFGRDVEFLRTPGFGVSTSLLLRGGVEY